MRKVIALVLFAALALSAAAEENGPPPESRLSKAGLKALASLRSPFTLKAGRYTIASVESSVAEATGLRFVHSSAAAALRNVSVSVDAEFTAALDEALDEVLAKGGLRKLLEYDGSVLVFSKGEEVDASDSVLASLPWPPPNRRALLARGLAGAVSFGFEDTGKRLESMPWRFRYCPVLAPWGIPETAVVSGPMLHEPLGRLLDALLEHTGFRRTNWGGVVLVIPEGISPGAEPQIDKAVVWRGKGEKSLAWLEKPLDTGLSRPGRASVDDLASALRAAGKWSVVHPSARMEFYRGLPAGEVTAGLMLAMLHHFDGLNFAWGSDWLLAWRGREPEAEIERLNRSAGSVVKVGEPLPPDPDIFETRPFSELPEEIADALRNMEAEQRLKRKIFVAFRRESLERAFLRLEVRAYFHFAWSDEAKKAAEKLFVEGYFEDKPVEEIIAALCKAGGLHWGFRDKKPMPGNRDMRFVINLYSIE